MEHPDEFFDDDENPNPPQLTGDQLAEKYRDPDEIEEERVERMVRLEEEAERNESFL